MNAAWLKIRAKLGMIVIEIFSIKKRNWSIEKQVSFALLKKRVNAKNVKEIDNIVETIKQYIQAILIRCNVKEGQYL